MVIQVALRNGAKESASILDNFVLEKYNESIKSYNGKARGFLGKFSSSKIGELTGSSPLMQIHLLNSGLLPEDVRLATRGELEVTIGKTPSFLQGSYYDFGIALLTSGDNNYKPNDLIAKALAEQLKYKGIELGGGKLIYFSAFDKPVDYEESDYGLLLKLKDLSARELDIRNLSDFNWNYQRGEGSACAYLFGGKGWVTSDFELLGRSDDGGRVVVVSGEATSQEILGRYVTKIEQERYSVIAKAQKEYSEREASLRA